MNEKERKVTNPRDRERTYKNDEITVFWKPTACIHASSCYNELIEVFNPGKRPWIDLKGSTTERIIETVNLCPTEALTWKWNEESQNEFVGSAQMNHIKFRRPELIVKKEEPISKPLLIRIMHDGPVVADGTFSIEHDGKKRIVSNSIISLCRCGASRHLPYCDGEHRIIGFVDK
jgi:uncharacterized Fe-S cluster protein YjdI